MKAGGDDPAQRVLGLIAQDVQKVLPEIVRKDKDGWLSVAYVEIIPILIEACKDLMKDISATKASVASFQSKLDSLTRAVSNIEAKKENFATASQLKELQAEIAQLKRRQRYQVPLFGRMCSIWWIVGISAAVVAIVLAVVLGVVLSANNNSNAPGASSGAPGSSTSGSPIRAPVQPPLPGTPLCDDCNSLFAFDVGPWSPNRFLNPSFEDPNPTDSNYALGWQPSSTEHPYTLQKTPSLPAPYAGSTAINISSFGWNGDFTGARQSVTFDFSLPNQYISMINFTGFVLPWKVVNRWEQGFSIAIDTVDLNSATPSQVTTEDFILNEPYYSTSLQTWQRVNFLYQRSGRCITRVAIHVYIGHSSIPTGGEMFADLFSLEHRYMTPKS
eukprot:TRINITY_DN4893_c0_g1_i1.p1 TRINITY_DN4893_c0_g1~~TRINITY_DN4893_c0_g1_i1.p1  ORF type:complete len:387 (+),score=53.49 TRINITY_DN4893_c0_g1_i1:992-2152(+)